MEILTECNAPQAWIIILTLVISITLGILGAFWALDDDDKKEAWGNCSLVIGLFILIVGVATGVHGFPSCKKYNIEINDHRAYQYLIENNYSIESRPYDSKNIYIITGDPLPDEWETDW